MYKKRIIMQNEKEELVYKGDVLRLIEETQESTTPMTDAYTALQTIHDAVKAARDRSEQYQRVVFCRDCIWFREEFPWDRCSYHDITTSDDSYCSDGRRAE